MFIVVIMLTILKISEFNGLFFIRKERENIDVDLNLREDQYFDYRYHCSHIKCTVQNLKISVNKLFYLEELNNVIHSRLKFNFTYSIPNEFGFKC